jgi:hypothetical protein
MSQIEKVPFFACDVSERWVHFPFAFGIQLPYEGFGEQGQFRLAAVASCSVLCIQLAGRHARIFVSSETKTRIA